MASDRWLWTVLAVASIAYLLNPGMGLFEFIPDNLPPGGEPG